MATMTTMATTNIMMHWMMNKLSDDLINHIKEYVLSREVLLEIFYQKYKLNEKKLKKMLSLFTSKQLEEINWKYLYHQIYLTSPPRYDNNNLVSFFHKLHNPKVSSSVFHDGDRDIYDYDYEPLIIYNPRSEVYLYKLNCITRSDYYSENVNTEKGKKRQQYQNIIDGWSFIRQGNKNTTSKNKEHLKTDETDKIRNYFLNVEYNLIRAIFVLQKTNKTNKQTNK